MELKKQLKTIFQNVKTANQEYDVLLTEIQNANYLMLTLSSFLSMISFFLLFIFSFFNSQIRFSQQFFLIIGFSLVSFIFLLINELILINRKKYVTFFIYLFILFLFSYAYYVDIFKNNENKSLIVYIIMFIVSVLFIDKSERMTLFLTSEIAVFMISSVLLKNIDMAIMDCINGVTFLFLELIISKYLTYIKLRDFLILHTTSSEDLDGLTGILSKKSLLREITKHLLVAQSDGIIILIDLKNLRQINDLYGWDFGDSILKQTSELIKNIFRNNDVVGRYAGDKIVVFMPNVSNMDIAKIRAKMVLSVFEEKIQIPENSLDFIANIGISSCDKYGETTKNLLKKVESALAEANSKGFNKIILK